MLIFGKDNWMIDLVYDYASSNFHCVSDWQTYPPFLTTWREQATVEIYGLDVWFYDYSKFLLCLLIENFTVSKSSNLHCPFQISSEFVWSDFLKLTIKFFNLIKSHMKNINHLFDFLYHRHSWRSETFYRTQIPSIDLEKHYFLCFPLTKISLNFHAANLLKWVTLRRFPDNAPITWNVFQFKHKHMTNVACFHGQHVSCLRGYLKYHSLCLPLQLLWKELIP